MCKYLTLWQDDQIIFITDIHKIDLERLVDIWIIITLLETVHWMYWNLCKFSYVSYFCTSSLWLKFWGGFFSFAFCWGFRIHFPFLCIAWVLIFVRGRSILSDYFFSYYIFTWLYLLANSYISVYHQTALQMEALYKTSEITIPNHSEILDYFKFL